LRAAFRLFGWEIIQMSKMADGRATVYKTTVLEERCEVIILQKSKTVFVANGHFKGRPIDADGGTQIGALRRWRHLAERSED
jgi:hypothetical protein